MSQPENFKKYILLEELLKKKNAVLSVAHIIYLVKEAGAGLDQAHHNLSPQNILISSTGNIKIINSGAVKSDNTSGNISGNISGLGTILSELLSKTESSAIPMDLNQIIIRALANDKNHRYQSATELCNDLSVLLNQEYPNFSPEQFGNFIKIFFAESRPSPNKDSARSNNIITFEPVNDYEVASFKDSTTSTAPPMPGHLDLPDGFGPNTNSQPNPQPQTSKEINFEVLQKKTLTKSLRNYENDDIFIKTAQYNHTHLSKKTTPINNSDDCPDNQSNSHFGPIFKIVAFSFFIFLAHGAFNKYWDKNSTYFSKLLEPLPAKNTSLTEQSSHSSAAQNTTSAKTPPSKNLSTLEHIKPIIVGYANITVSDKSPYVKVSINGIELLNRPPILMFPIISGKENIISAYNPVTKKYAQQRVIVKPKQSFKVMLVLKKESKKNHMKK